MIEPPLRVNYGNNVTFKGQIYINMGLSILGACPYPSDRRSSPLLIESGPFLLSSSYTDENIVTFGSRVLIAPNVTILTPTHPVDVDGRREGTIQAFPVEVSLGSGVKRKERGASPKLHHILSMLADRRRRELFRTVS